MSASGLCVCASSLRSPGGCRYVNLGIRGRIEPYPEERFPEGMREDGAGSQCACVQSVWRLGVTIWRLARSAEKRGLRLYYPELTAVDVQKTLDKASSFPQVDIPCWPLWVPVPKQGKFTLQLALRHRFLELGYRWGRSARNTMRNSSDGLRLPNGYASSIRMPLDWYVPFLDAKMREISHFRKPHLLLVWNAVWYGAL